MKQDELHAVIEQWLRESLGRPDLQVDTVGPPRHRSAELSAAWRAEKYSGGGERDLEGVIPLDAAIRATGAGEPAIMPLLLKVRNGAGLGRTAIPPWFERAGIRLSRPLEEYGTIAEFLESRDREIAVYRLQRDQDAFARYLPRALGDRVRPDRDEYLLLVERVDRARLMDTGDDVSGWTIDRVLAMIDAAAALQAPWLGHVDELAGGPWPAHARDAAVVARDRELWQELLDSGRRHFPEIVDADVYRTGDELIDTIEEWYRPRDELPQTLVHDDLNPRNACFRDDGRPLIYDWELAMVDIPQRDLAELLTFVLDPVRDAGDRAIVRRLVEHHREQLAKASGVALDPDAWWEGFRIAVRLEAINRVAYQWLFATAIQLAYVARITRTIHALLGVS